jgi:hypothetical protein
MHMKRLALKLGLAGLLVSSVAFAGWSTNSGVKITQVEIDPSTTSGANGTASWVGFSPMPNNKPSCAGGSQVVFVGTAEHVRALTSLATAAFLAGRNVRVNWNGSCTGSYGQVTHLLVE